MLTKICRYLAHTTIIYLYTLHIQGISCLQKIFTQNKQSLMKSIQKWFHEMMHPEHPKMKMTDLSEMEGRKEMFYLTTHSTHFIYGYMASDIW